MESKLEKTTPQGCFSSCSLTYVLRMMLCEYAKDKCPYQRRDKIIFPNTAILEAITALKRAKNLPKKAHLINKQYQSGAFLIEFVTEEIQKRASIRFEKMISKKHTIFNAVVAELSLELDAEYIFSFDDLYVKQGFRLAKV